VTTLMELPFPDPPWLGEPHPLSEYEVIEAQRTIAANHYTHTVPSGKSYYARYEDALVVWSIPANCNLAAFILGWQGEVWELSRLWAPDGHRPNLLTQAIAYGVRVLRAVEPKVDAAVSYADPNAGHSGGIYRAASWLYHGQSDETRAYRSPSGQMIARRAFHSGSNGLTKAGIEALGYNEHKLPGKHRFVRPISRQARRALQSVFNQQEVQP
jgi:hypothetical protein